MHHFTSTLAVLVLCGLVVCLAFEDAEFNPKFKRDQFVKRQLGGLGGLTSGLPLPGLGGGGLDLGVISRLVNQVLGMLGGLTGGLGGLGGLTGGLGGLLGGGRGGGLLGGKK